MVGHQAVGMEMKGVTDSCVFNKFKIPPIILLLKKQRTLPVSPARHMILSTRIPHTYISNQYNHSLIHNKYHSKMKIVLSVTGTLSMLYTMKMAQSVTGTFSLFYIIQIFSIQAFD